MIPRYSRKEITEVWDPKNKFQIWLNIEILICEALNKYGKIPNSALKNIKKISSTGVNRISIGQITHSAPSVDCKLDFIS